MVKHQKSEIKINRSLGECWYLIYWLTLPHFRACPKPGHGFPMPYISHGVFSIQMFEVIVWFVDIDGTFCS